MDNTDSKPPENTDRNQNYEHLTTDDNKVDSERLTTDSVGQKEVLVNNTLNENAEQNHVDEGSPTSTLPRKSGVKPKCQVRSSWTLRPKSREKPKDPEPSGTVKEGSVVVEKKRSVVVEKKRSGKNKKVKKKTASHEFSRTRSHLRYLLHRIKYEQNLIDAYTAEGWKGQSLEKLKPEKELHQARSHILRYKLKIRALFQELDKSLSLGKIPEALFGDEGEIDSEDIFCAKCGCKDVTLDNDIVLCDGPCERGFHQYCLQPPLPKQDIPQGDNEWRCPGCDCKADCIEMVEDFQGTKVSYLDSWEKIFPEAASGNNPSDGLGSSSDDSEDEDFEPESPNVEKVEQEDSSSSDDSGYVSALNDLAPPTNDENNVMLPSDDSEDDDFDLSEPDQDVHSKADRSSSDFTSDSEDLGALLDDAAVAGEDKGNVSLSSGRISQISLQKELSYLVETIGEPVTAKRHVERLDYKKLNDETFVNQSSDSSDEDFEDGTSRKRRRIKQDKNDASTCKTRLTNLDSQGETPRKNKQYNVDSASTSTTKESMKSIGEAAKKRLCEAFKENQNPEKSVRDNLAIELGITARQLCKWFGNARWYLRHKGRMPDGTKEGANNGILDQNSTLDSVPLQKSRKGRRK